MVSDSKFRVLFAAIIYLFLFCFFNNLQMSITNHVVGFGE
jgi:hypothetical protein